MGTLSKMVVVSVNDIKQYENSSMMPSSITDQ